jgi:hypothetical protein
MHLRGDVAGRQSGDLSDGCGIEPLEIEQDDLPVDGL